MPIEKNESFPTLEQTNIETLFRDESGYGFDEGMVRGAVLERVGVGIGVTAVSLGIIGGTAVAKDVVPLGISEQSTQFAPSDKVSEAIEKQQEKRRQDRCERQSELDPVTYNSCEYQGAYVAISKKHPAWVRSKKLAEPGSEEKADRKKLYFKTHPKVYQRLLLENQAGANYKSPNFKLWEDGVNDNECKDTWNCNTGNGYYGGLQMDVTFQKTYNPTAVKVWGLASNWPRNAQMLAADRAYSGYNGFGARGLGPWPTSRNQFGTYPAPIRKITVPKLVIN